MPRNPQLDSVHIPKGFEYLWILFWELRRGASAGFSGTSVTWQCLDDYQAVTGISLDGFELEAIIAMDNAIRESMEG